MYFRAVKRKQGAVYCPACGKQSCWTGKSEEQLLRDRLTSKQALVDRLNEDIRHKDRKLSASKGQMTKLKNRVKNGVCPCCNRTFVNLLRHMKSKHPEYDS